ncbi:Rab proteins geranylgeranyltransferase component A, partial [Ascosphaera acerosa]
MEQITDTLWDVVIAGTGLQQALLALALSRSGKKILHVDKEDYYGGAEAALTLNEVAAWVARVNEGNGSCPFEDASVTDYTVAAKAGGVDGDEGDGGRPQLGFPRAYTLSLAPQLLYARARMLSTLVDSKIFRQLDFLAAGSWWICRPARGESSGAGEASAQSTAGPTLTRVPNGREDVFADDAIPMKSKRALIKFLR